MALLQAHTAVMTEEVLEYLSLKPGDFILDCTVGAGGHSKKILEKITRGGMLIGIDKDSQALEAAQKQLKDFNEAVVLRQADFRDLDIVLADVCKQRGRKTIDGALFDLGVSSLQLGSAQRGFSFGQDGPLDMRMCPGKGQSAYDLVNSLSKDELAGIIFKFGEERNSRRIAAAITEARRRSPIKTTAHLEKIILKALPKGRKWQRIHPATRTFQALRIAVNDELAALEDGLAKATLALAAGGRICVISFHSLEDRIVKNFFKAKGKEAALRILTKKPLRPKEEEIKRNPRARSAKLRAAEKPA